MLYTKPLAHSRSRRRRGSQILEFALVVPFFLAFIFLAVDMGWMVLMHGVVTNAAYSAAQVGAQDGGGGGTNGPSQQAFQQAMFGVPASNLQQATVQVTTGQVCQQFSATQSFVTVQAAIPVNFITPGLGAILSLLGGQGLSNTWKLQAVGVARCEVVRAP